MGGQTGSAGNSDGGLAGSTLPPTNTGAQLLGWAPMFLGAPDWGRTSDLCLRRAALYPTELRVRRVFMMTLLLGWAQPSALAALSIYRTVPRTVLPLFASLSRGDGASHLSDSPPDCPPAPRFAQSRRWSLPTELRVRRVVMMTLLLGWAQPGLNSRWRWLCASRSWRHRRSSGGHRW